MTELQILQKRFNLLKDEYESEVHKAIIEYLREINAKTSAERVESVRRLLENAHEEGHELK